VTNPSGDHSPVINQQQRDPRRLLNKLRPSHLRGRVSPNNQALYCNRKLEKLEEAEEAQGMHPTAAPRFVRSAHAAEQTSGTRSQQGFILNLISSRKAKMWEINAPRLDKQRPFNAHRPLEWEKGVLACASSTVNIAKVLLRLSSLPLNLSSILAI
jgi:hypothetical protein